MSSEPASTSRTPDTSGPSGPAVSSAPPRTPEPPSSPRPSSASPPPPASPPPAESLWQDRDFRTFFSAVVLSQLATQVNFVAIPLIAVLALGAGPGEVGLLATLGTVSFLLIGLPAGAWLDRLDHRRVMICAELVRGTLFLSLPLAWALDVLTLWQLAAVTLLTGCAMVFFDVGTQSMLPTLVGPARLVQANAAVVGLQAAGQIAGRGGAGLAVQVLSAPVAAVATGLMFLGSVLRLTAVRVPAATGARKPPGKGPGLAGQIAEGLRHVLGSRELRALAAVGVLSNLGGTFLMTLMPVLFTREPGLSAGTLGLFWSVGGVGIFLGSRFARRWGERYGYGRTITVSALVLSPGALLMPLVGGGWWLAVAIAGLLLDTVRLGAFNVLAVTLRQSLTPVELLGRMNATFRFLLFGAMAVGAALAGVVGQYAGIRTAMWIGAGCLMLTFLPGLTGLRGGRWWRGAPGRTPLR
ncbi:MULTISPECIES: MFS transporter [Streptomyces]|uniref:MFS transporter n=1 Tax=Streptomyces TaxID=1883 RepID=UPI00025CD8D1|nr:MULTISPECIES: MFS transporter [Streptomyces]AZK94607.1 MFS transporter [Streptomyces tsukubensis]EIF90416.1 major facilitator superfamily protein [Streptomyces tsukubensis NRRL18488]